jgi:orotate phosphoribosyltransferase
MTPADVLTLFREAGALLEGHFRLSSGLHSSGYLQCALVLQRPAEATRLGEALASLTRHLEPTVVLSPALGGIVIGHEVARALGVRAIFAERQDGRLTLRRGFALDVADRVLVVEDVLTTGLSTRETIEVARQAGAAVAGAASIIDRGAATDVVVPYVALAKVSLPAYETADCPLCAEGRPLVKPGSRESQAPEVGRYR